MAQPSPHEMARSLADLLGAMASIASEVAHSKRVLYEAYLSEGFNEQQALELVKSSGV